MKVTALIENNSCAEGISAEHGLSLYIETGDRRILFDVGQSELFADNARKLGIDLSMVDIAIISHGHYDHGGGLAKFLRINDSANVLINRNAFFEYYNKDGKYIGLDSKLQTSDRIVFAGDEHRINDDICLFTCNGMERRYGFSNFGLTKKKGKETIPDDFIHEQYLVIKEGDKTVLFSGCSHKGIFNIIEWFHPDMVIGGFHFSKMPCDNYLADIASELDKYDIEFYTCHCTGTEQYDFMKKYIRKLNYISSGQTVCI